MYSMSIYMLDAMVIASIDKKNWLSAEAQTILYFLET